MTQIVLGARNPAGTPPNLPPTGYLWLMASVADLALAGITSAVDLYCVDDSSNYILVVTPYVPWV